MEVLSITHGPIISLVQSLGLFGGYFQGRFLRLARNYFDIFDNLSLCILSRCLRVITDLHFQN